MSGFFILFWRGGVGGGSIFSSAEEEEENAALHPFPAHLHFKRPEGAPVFADGRADQTRVST